MVHRRLTASTGSLGSPDLGVFANYGILGIFTLVLLGFGFRAWQREITRADRLEVELRDKNQVMLDKVIPGKYVRQDRARRHREADQGSRRGARTGNAAPSGWGVTSVVITEPGTAPVAGRGDAGAGPGQGNFSRLSTWCRRTWVMTEFEPETS